MSNISHDRKTGALKRGLLDRRAQRRPRILLLIASLIGGFASFGCEVTDEKKTTAPTNQQDEGQCPAELKLPHSARLLTQSEYRRTVQDLLGIEFDPTEAFPSQPLVSGFDNNAATHLANPLLVEKHASSASQVVTSAKQKGLQAVLACHHTSEAQCALEFVSEFGLRAFRRPLDSAERGAFETLYESEATTFGHEEALWSVVEAMLQSPQFLYRLEDVASATDQGENTPSSYELASRMSYFLWGSLPDDELFMAAESNMLQDPAAVELQARRMLKDPRAYSRIREFFSLWLHLSRLDSIARDEELTNVSGSWRESILQFVDSIFRQEGGSIDELFSSPTIFLDGTLAPLYGEEPPESGWALYSNTTERSGILTQPGVMALLSHADQSSPIQRGVFVREQVLCAPLAPPPANIDNNPPDPDPSLTTRERFLVHTEAPVCANCHSLIDPLGLGFEAYDHLGRYRTQENGLNIDPSGGIVEVDEPALEGDFADAFELSARLASSDTVLNCLTRKWFIFAMGQAGWENYACSIQAASLRAQNEGRNLQEVLVAIVASPAFRGANSTQSGARLQ